MAHPHVALNLTADTQGYRAEFERLKRLLITPGCTAPPDDLAEILKAIETLERAGIDCSDLQMKEQP